MIKRILPAVALCSALATPVQAQEYSGLYVFGDSLSDSGNLFGLTGGTNPPSPPYFNGRVSNGPVWVESLAPALGLTYTQATNFAIAGAEAGSLNAIDVGNQILGFVGAGGTVPADALTVVWAGNNDFLRNAATTPASELTTTVVTSIGTAIGTLNAFGAQTFLVPNLPKFGNSPGGASTGLGPQLNELASFYNGNLHTTLIGLEESLGIQVFIMDVEGLFDDVIADPGAYGMSNVTIPCLDGLAQPTGVCPTTAAADATLFWDAIHPTGAAHSIVSQFAQATLEMYDQPRVVAHTSYMGPIIMDAQRQTTEQRLMTIRSTSNGSSAPGHIYASYRVATGDRAGNASLEGFDYDLDTFTLGVDKVVGSVGLEIGGAYSTRNVRIVPLVRVAYETELDSIDYGASIQTSTGHIVGVGRGGDSKNRITANAGLALVSEHFSLSVSYQGSVDYSDGKDEGFVGRVSYSF